MHSPNHLIITLLAACLPTLLVAQTVSDSPEGIGVSSQTVASGEQHYLPPPELVPENLEGGECWVYAPVKPRAVQETVDVVVQEEAVKVSVVPAEVRNSTRRVVTREGVKTYRVAPATFKQVTEKVLVTPETPRIEVVPAVYEEREAELTVEEGRTVLEPCRAAGTEYARGTGSMAFCTREIPPQTKTVKVKVLVEPETTRVTYEPAVYKEVTRWVVDQPGRVIEVMESPEIAEIPVDEVVSPEKTTEEIRPAITKSMKMTRYEGSPRVVLRQALCGPEITAEFVEALQRELADRNYYPGDIDGILGSRTLDALGEFQADNGLAVGAITLESIEVLGFR